MNSGETKLIFIVDKQKSLEKWKPVIDSLSGYTGGWNTGHYHFTNERFNETPEERLERERIDKRNQRENKMKRIIKSNE